MSNLQADLDALLENEALTADLDDDAANLLLDWGMARVRLMHRLAVDEPDPEGYIAVQTKANRKMMRSVNNWTATRARQDLAEHLAALREILSQAGVNASPEQHPLFLAAHLSEPPPDFIASLRSFCENS